MTGSGAPGRAIRKDLQFIADLIAPGSRVLDIGCGDGTLLAYLGIEKGVDGRGIELSQEGVNACVGHGLSVIQGDADTDLADYPAHAFDYVVLSNTLQATHDPRGVLQNLVRIGRHAVVSFPNFGHWRLRADFVAQGRMPVINGINGTGERWYDSPNIHLCTFRDFAELCAALDLRVERAIVLNRAGRAREIETVGAWANLIGAAGIFVLTRR
jgi:methionine biosynthesis protein MetW